MTSDQGKQKAKHAGRLFSFDDPDTTETSQPVAPPVHAAGEPHHAVQDSHPTASGAASDAPPVAKASATTCESSGPTRGNPADRPPAVSGRVVKRVSRRRSSPHLFGSDGTGTSHYGEQTEGIFGRRHRVADADDQHDRRDFRSRVTDRRSTRSLFDAPAPNAEQPLRPAAAIAANARPSTAKASISAAIVPSGERAKAIANIEAIETLLMLERDQRLPTAAEREVLQGFSGFGPVARSVFPDPVSGRYRDATWQQLGQRLEQLLSRGDYHSAKRTTFTAFYTSPAVMDAIHSAIHRLGVSEQGQILEPGCGIGNFMGRAVTGHRFIGIEMDAISARIARQLYPQHDIRCENFRDTKLSAGQLDAVTGNVPFADVKMEHKGQKFSLHDYFFAKSVDALKPGGVIAMVTSHFTMDKQNAAIREYLANQADFVGAIRLPSDAFKREGTAVVTDIVFLRKRAEGEPACHQDPDWLQTGPLSIDGATVSVNRYFLNHPEMVLGTWSRKDTLYGGEGFSIQGTGDLPAQLDAAIQRLPEFAPVESVAFRSADASTFIPPPPQRSLSEGSFFVNGDKAICQIEGGQGVPVVYGGTALKSDGTMTGRRFAVLLELRDQARRVLQSQNEGWPDDLRQSARKELNRTYDRFVAAYGPINKTTFGETKDGSVIRRMPNLVKFREDPDAMLVMSLEEYDEVTGRATRAPIMERDVVGRHEQVTRVRTAEEGLLVSLNRFGSVNLAEIAKLYGRPESQVIQELGDLIYRNPETRQWETADVYLSGNVREKLRQAENGDPEYLRNAAALRAVQPEDVLPGDIDANLGAAWIPVSDIQQFAATLFHVPLGAIAITQLKKDAVWSLQPNYQATNSVAATSDFGTSRINGTTLLELALNMKSPTIYDTVVDGDRETRVVNQQETMAAREKQKLIKERFRSWVFADPDRAERLVRIYNDTYNNLRPRRFDGSHLDFPGMTEQVRLRPHQKDAIWRGMSSGNTLLAHVVGAGKTFTMAATGMKMKQAGLICKPMYVVPNHLLEQFAREFIQLYPNARLLIASKEDLTRERRKMLTARIATGDWDGIIVTHSSFERIGMSRDYQEKFLREQIDEYDELLREHAADRQTNRNLIKTIEKQKAARAEKLNQLFAEDKKDDGLVFDELGVDHIFVDEAHAFKNLETPSKMERVAGIQTGGSERSFDIYMKARYLGERHPGHGVTFATGTPISNTMVEMYTMQRYLDPEGLRSRGIEHFDAWAGTFGEVIDTMEISPDGAGLRPRSRFAKFTNLPELQQMFRAFADVQTADMLNLPRPKLKGGKPIVVASPMSAAQAALQQRLVERYEKIRNEKVDPRTDNALAITTDGRKLATDARMLDPQAGDYPDSKINRLVQNVFDIWEHSRDIRGTQLVFADMGVNETAWGFSPYSEIMAKLSDPGIPADQIAAIGDADSDAKKQVLFEKVRNGTVRILLGSTQKMGTGTNVQKRLVALHHLDAPWKPAEVEQRDGRILRQGNMNDEVEIYRYVTEGSFDSYMWQALETKARFIGQVITGDNASRTADDIGSQELSFAEVKAIASGNPAVLTLAEADAELQRLAILRKNHLDEQFIARRQVRDLPSRIESLKKRIQLLREDQLVLSQHSADHIQIGSRILHPEDVMDVLGARLEQLPGKVLEPTRVELGRYRGLGFGLTLRPGSSPDVFLEGQVMRFTATSGKTPGPRALLNAAERIASGYTQEIAYAEADLQLAETQLADYSQRIGNAFSLESYLNELTTLRNLLKESLSATAAAQGTAGDVTATASRIKELIASADSRTASARTESREVSAEEPIAQRVRRRLEAEAHDESAERDLPVPNTTRFVDQVTHSREAACHNDLALA
jgi:N12 class adenine-specific DNA methylase